MIRFAVSLGAELDAVFRKILDALDAWRLPD